VSLTCNIDQRGRRARSVTGVICDACGTGLLVGGILSSTLWLIITGGAISVAGAFMIFEGAKGWCALRAMGIKTPM
jgi:hypothetical protein